MVSQKRIKDYQDWFENLSFFSFNSFILDEIENLWNLLNYIYYNYSEVLKRVEFEKNDFSFVSLEENIYMAQQFFDKYHINISIKDMIKANILTFKKIENQNSKETVGASYYDEEKNKKIEVYLDDTIIDSGVIIHEIMHYLNQPETERSFVSDLLTESVSYGIEFIYVEELKKSPYCDETEKFMKAVSRIIYRLMDKIYYIYKLILLYKKEKDISLEAYNKIFKDNNYEEMLECFEKYAIEKKLIVRDTWNVLGFPIAIYMLETYKNDNDFIKKIIEYHEAINEKSYQECLSIIGLSSDKDFIDKIKSSTNSFLESLCNQKVKKL